MKMLFVDTAGWLMLANEAEPLHKAAVRAVDSWLEVDGILVSTDYVLDETLTTIRARIGIDGAEKWWRQVECSRRLRWEWIEPMTVEKARSLFFRWRDKSFSFTDCTSFVVMRERRIKTALTSDAHFVQAGFEIVPRS